jgi:long-chain acyl-CoA synthetase
MKPRTVYTVLEETAAIYPDKPALHQPLGAGKYRTWTWREYRDTVQQIAVGIRELGVPKGGMVALQSETRAEFYLTDIGIMTSGAIAAALYTSLPYADQAKTLKASDATVVFVENEKVMKALQNASLEPLNVKWILLTDDSVRALGEQKMREDPGVFDRIRAEVSETDLAVLYMTSGATGEPKMGLVSHRALVTNMDMSPVNFPLSPDDCTIAFLPSAHIAQRVVVELLPIREGGVIWFSEGLAKMPNELRKIRPTFFLAPPRVWERIYSTVSAEIRKRPAAVRRLFYTAIGLGAEASRRKQEGKEVPPWMRASLKIFDRLVFTKIRERLGGRMRLAASGAAPLSKDLAEFYGAIGMPLVEGYGLTEGGVAALNPFARPKAGSIGKLLPGIEGRLEEDGELMLRGASLFSGYYKDPEATAAVLRDGWLATGDIAEVDSDGYYYITGRKKELIVSSNGKKIYPSRIEGMLKKEPAINQVLLIGDRMPYVTALFTVHGAPHEARASIEKAVKDVNKQLASFEQVRKFKILERDFSIEEGELTPTMKVRRNRVLENHRALVSEMYLGKDVD